MVNRLIMLISLVASIVLVAMANFTNPAEVGPLGVLVFFTTIPLRRRQDNGNSGGYSNNGSSIYPLNCYSFWDKNL